MEPNIHIQNILKVWEVENSLKVPNKNTDAQKIAEQWAFTFSTGPYYYLMFNFVTGEMEYVHFTMRDILDIDPKEFTLNKLFEVMHPEDLELMHKKENLATNFLLKQIKVEEIPFYKVSYLMRLKHKSGHYKTLLHQSQAITFSKDGFIQQVIAVHTDLSYLHITMNHDVSFLSNRYPSFYASLPDYNLQSLSSKTKPLFTPREIEILHLTAKGRNGNEIANTLFVSPHTVKTHKKNLLSKARCNNMTELIAKCIRDGVI